MRKPTLIPATFLSFILFNSTYANQPIVCETNYALCSAAKCVQIPGVPGKVICRCSIWHGKNIGYSSCSERQGKKDQLNQTHLLSTFAFGGFHYRVNTCKVKQVWASCLDQPCIVDPSDSRRAYCTCKLMHSTPYVTFATDCQQKNCSKYIWSGATPEGNALLVKKLVKSIGLTQLPKTLNCNINKE